MDRFPHIAPGPMWGKMADGTGGGGGAGAAPGGAPAAASVGLLGGASAALQFARAGPGLLAGILGDVRGGARAGGGVAAGAGAAASWPPPTGGGLRGGAPAGGPPPPSSPPGAHSDRNGRFSSPAGGADGPEHIGPGPVPDAAPHGASPPPSFRPAKPEKRSVPIEFYTAPSGEEMACYVDPDTNTVQHVSVNLRGVDLAKMDDETRHEFKYYGKDSTVYARGFNDLVYSLILRNPELRRAKKMVRGQLANAYNNRTEEKRSRRQRQRINQGLREAGMPVPGRGRGKRSRSLDSAAPLRVRRKAAPTVGSSPERPAPSDARASLRMEMRALDYAAQPSHAVLPQSRSLGGFLPAGLFQTAPQDDAPGMQHHEGAVLPRPPQMHRSFAHASPGFLPGSLDPTPDPSALLASASMPAPAPFNGSASLDALLGRRPRTAAHPSPHFLPGSLDPSPHPSPATLSSASMPALASFNGSASLDAGNSSFDGARKLVSPTVQPFGPPSAFPSAQQQMPDSEPVSPTFIHGAWFPDPPVQAPQGPGGWGFPEIVFPPRRRPAAQLQMQVPWDADGHAAPASASGGFDAAAAVAGQLDREFEWAAHARRAEALRAFPTPRPGAARWPPSPMPTPPAVVGLGIEAAGWSAMRAGMPTPLLTPAPAASGAPSIHAGLADLERLLASGLGATWGDPQSWGGDERTGTPATDATLRDPNGASREWM
ncbi:hypothetical protein DFJ74DRAFT_728962 [Hyaloraphidium curvatum]|nr:hypothetical protein DFJ74DRAFT_728962 [Hyaloraphidium curvatum]